MTNSAKRVIRGRKIDHSASVNTGRVDSGADFVPWTVRVHSHDDQHFGAGVPAKFQLGLGRGELGVRVALQQECRVPARNEHEAELGQLGLQLRRRRRKLVALLHALEADLAGLAQALLQRDVSANLDHVVVGPANRIGADTDHRLAPG